MLVQDVRRTVAFYRDKLGFRLVMSAPSVGDALAWALLRRGGIELYFEARHRWPTELIPLPTTPPRLTFYLDAHDADEIFLSIPADVAVTELEDEAFSVVDPDGFTLIFVPSRVSLRRAA